MRWTRSSEVSQSQEFWVVILTDLVFNPIAYETDASVSSKIGFLEKILKSTTRGAG